MAKLTSAARKKLSPGSFALPGRKYPIEDKTHADDALSRVSEYGTPGQKSRVRAAVSRKFPSIGKGKRPEKKDPNSLSERLLRAM